MKVVWPTARSRSEGYPGKTTRCSWGWNEGRWTAIAGRVLLLEQYQGTGIAIEVALASKGVLVTPGLQEAPEASCNRESVFDTKADMEAFSASVDEERLACCAGGLHYQSASRFGSSSSS